MQKEVRSRPTLGDQEAGIPAGNPEELRLLPSALTRSHCRATFVIVWQPTATDL
ncbi:MAG: hypothetical protein H7326_10530 [Bdellovibrionaceae bacterium]|nr:hypothetical protein [Pseudobdellovibrionaceae bacterium]